MQITLAGIRRHFITIIFPVFTAAAIYADWSRTRRFKALQAQRQLELNQDLVDTS
jgi:hypothetical protein